MEVIILMTRVVLVLWMGSTTFIIGKLWKAVALSETLCKITFARKFWRSWETLSGFCTLQEETGQLDRPYSLECSWIFSPRHNLLECSKGVVLQLSERATEQLNPDDPHPPNPTHPDPILTPLLNQFWPQIAARGQNFRSKLVQKGG